MGVWGDVFRDVESLNSFWSRERLHPSSTRTRSHTVQYIQETQRLWRPRAQKVGFYARVFDPIVHLQRHVDDERKLIFGDYAVAHSRQTSHISDSTSPLVYGEEADAWWIMSPVVFILRDAMENYGL